MGSSTFITGVLLLLFGVEIAFQLFTHVTLPNHSLLTGGSSSSTTTTIDQTTLLSQHEKLELHTMSFLKKTKTNTKKAEEPPPATASSPLLLRKSSSSSSSLHLPRCRILVINSIKNHAEILESIMTLPLDMLNLEDDNDNIGESSNNSTLKCNPHRRIFDFGLIADGMSWKDYYSNTLKTKYDDQNDNAEVVIGNLVPYNRTADDSSKYVAIIEATCKCVKDDVQWLSQNSRRRCILHRKCVRYANKSKQYLSVSPFNPRFFLPNALPPVPEANRRRRKPVQPPYQLCVVGRNYRRNFKFVREYFDSHNENSKAYNFDKFHVQIYGSSEIRPPILKPYNKEHVTKTNITEFQQFQQQVATNCDVLLALVDKTNFKQYFQDQLTGTVPQASAYNIPIVIHEELALLYKQYLPGMYETHNDNNQTFVKAVDRMLQRLDDEQQKK